MEGEHPASGTTTEVRTKEAAPISLSETMSKEHDINNNAYLGIRLLLSSSQFKTFVETNGLMQIFTTIGIKVS